MLVIEAAGANLYAFSIYLRMLIVGATLRRPLPKWRLKQATRWFSSIRAKPGERMNGSLFTIDRRWPSTAMVDLAPDERTAVVTLCHDPKLDDPALLVALERRHFTSGRR